MGIPVPSMFLKGDKTSGQRTLWVVWRYITSPLDHVTERAFVEESSAVLGVTEPGGR